MALSNPSSTDPVYTPGTARGAKLAALLVDEGTALVRKIFEDEVQNMNPPSLREQLQKHKRYLFHGQAYKHDGRNRRVNLNPHQKQTLYPPSGDVADTAQGFDLTLLDFLLRELVWLELGKDAPYSAERDRLRRFRNDNYGHISTMDLSEEDFNRLWKELTDILVALGGDRDKISERLNSSIDPGQQVLLEEVAREEKVVTRSPGTDSGKPKESSSKAVDVSRYFDIVIRGASASWDDLARLLNFIENEITIIQAMERGDDRRCREMLNRWRNWEGKAATLKVLKRALVGIGHRRTAESLEDSSYTSESSGEDDQERSSKSGQKTGGSSDSSYSSESSDEDDQERSSMSGQKTEGTSDAFETLKHLLTEVRVEDDSRTAANYDRLSRHVAESGLTFRAKVPKDGNCMFHAVAGQLFRTEGRRISHGELRKQVVDYLRQNPLNGVGDHLRNFVPDQNWEGYLSTMSRDGTWGDHIVLQAMADMFGHDVSIVSSVEAENYVTILTPSTGTVGRKEPPLLLGHYAENHYASLDDHPNPRRDETDDAEASQNLESSFDGKLTVKVQPCTDAFRKRTMKEKSPYKMGSLPRGYALILCNTKFDKLPYRQGGDVDLDNMKALFAGLSFETYILQNKKAQTIRDEIRAFSKREKHGKVDSCIVVLISNGTKDTIFGTDGELVQLGEIFTMFDNENCPLLKGKPKLFFIQACRGDGKGTYGSPRTVMLPARTDMVCCYATQPGHVSFRNPTSGSWFIQAITKVFMEHAKDNSLLELMTKVFDEVSKRTARTSRPIYSGGKQVPDIVSTLRKPLYLFPVSASVPLEVELGGPELRALYGRACKEGTIEMYSTRFVLIGKFGNGKTNLCNSLLGDDFDPEWKITDGIAIHPCVMTQEQQWEELEGQQDQLPYAAAEWMKKMEDDNPKRSKPPAGAEYKQVQNESFGNMQSAMTNLEEAPESQPSEPTKPTIAASEVQFVETPSETTEVRSKNYLKTIEIFKSFRTNDDRSSPNVTGTKEYPQISIWDFGGQEIFYSTQQVFYTHRAIYGMTMDLTKPLNLTVKTASDSGPPCHLHKEKDYIDYHLESIGMHTRSTRETKPPPVLFIFTHKDEVTEETMQTFHDETRKHLKGKEINKHVIGRYFSVDNTKRKPEDPEMAGLRNAILDLAKKQSYMGEKIPMQWLELRSKLHDMHKDGKRYCSLKQVMEAIGSPPAGTTQKENTVSILTFWHLYGDIIYFPEIENLRDFVILDPQWFVDVCKTIITIPQYQDQGPGDRDDWDWLRETGRLRDRLIEQVWRNRKDLIDHKQELLDMMEKFDLVLRCYGRVDEETGTKYDRDEQATYFVPALLTTVTDAKRLYPTDTTCSKPIFIKFDGKFCPVGLYHRLVVNSTRRYDRKKPLAFASCARFITSNLQQTLIVTKEKFYLKIELVSSVQDDASRFSHGPAVRAGLDEDLKEIIDKWAPGIGYEWCLRCCCADHKAKEDVERFLPIEEATATEGFKNGNVVCEANAPATTSIRDIGLADWFHDPLRADERSSAQQRSPPSGGKSSSASKHKHHSESSNSADKNTPDSSTRRQTRAEQKTRKRSADQEAPTAVKRRKQLPGAKQGTRKGRLTEDAAFTNSPSSGTRLSRSTAKRPKSPQPSCSSAKGTTTSGKSSGSSKHIYFTDSSNSSDEDSPDVSPRRQTTRKSSAKGQKTKKRSDASVRSPDREAPAKRRNGHKGAKKEAGRSGRKVDVSKYFDKVISGTSADWADLARKLKFKENEIEGIEERKRDNDSRCREVLKRWRNRKSKVATIKALKKALAKIGHQFTADHLEDSSGSSESSEDCN